jgi:hypothetical protein
MLTVTPLGFHHFYDDGFIHETGGFGEDILVPRILSERFHLSIIVTQMPLKSVPCFFIKFHVSTS